MATQQELEQKIQDLQASLTNSLIPDALKGNIQQEIDKTQTELDDLLASQNIGSQPTAGQVPSGYAMAAMASLRNVMASGAGSGVDSAEVRRLIEEYLMNEKVNLAELDNDVIEEIKRNQKLEITLPNFGKIKIEVNKRDADIPYFFDIIDDVLAGNNVYLIGAAGGGKTYTAEQVAKTLQREGLIINCSQYTSPTEILGGQTIEGYKEGKLINAWRNGKILILDEMPRLDPNTAGLFNDALAKSSHTRMPEDAKINSTNPEEPAVKRNNNFGLIGTGNVYPNTAPPEEYKANRQQDLSLLDRFSGSVYKVEYAQIVDENNCRYQFLYELLVGNYYQYVDAIKNNQPRITPTGLRTVLKDLNLDNLAVVSYRTLISFRVAFEYQLVRELEKNKGNAILDRGKTLQKAVDSFMIAFQETTVETIKSALSLTPASLNAQVQDAITKIKNGNLLDTLTPQVKNSVSNIIKYYEDMFVPSIMEVNNIP